MNLIAAYPLQAGANGRFDCEILRLRMRNTQRWQALAPRATHQTPHARSMRTAGKKMAIKARGICIAYNTTGILPMKKISQIPVTTPLSGCAIFVDEFDAGSGSKFSDYANRTAATAVHGSQK